MKTVQCPTCKRIVSVRELLIEKHLTYGGVLCMASDLDAPVSSDSGGDE